MKNKVIASGKPKGVSRSPWVCKIGEWAKDAQGKQMGKWAKDAQEEINGTKEPTSNVIKEKAQNSMSMNPMTILSD